MAHIVQKMADTFIAPFIHSEQPDLNLMNQKEEEVDFLRDRINSYLLKIISGDIESERTQEAFQIMYTVKEFEQIADILRDTYFNKTHEWIEKRHEFSDEGKEELSSYHIQVLKQLARSVEVFREVNLEKAKLMKTKHNKYRIYAMDLEKSHYRRLMEMKEKSLNTSKTHLELMSALQTVYSHATNIARIILQWSDKNRDNNGTGESPNP
jgi:phosphate:Na+ symporter